MRACPGSNSRAAKTKSSPVKNQESIGFADGQRRAAGLLKHYFRPFVFDGYCIPIVGTLRWDNLERRGAEIGLSFSSGLNWRFGRHLHSILARAWEPGLLDCRFILQKIGAADRTPLYTREGTVNNYSFSPIRSLPQPHENRLSDPLENILQLFGGWCVVCLSTGC